MIIAVDGPTASGKGTIAKALAHHFGLPHLDTGLLYRAVGRQCFQDGGNPDDPVDALAACAFPEGLLADPELRSEASGGLASRVSIHPTVRQALYERQHAFATQPGGAEPCEDRAQRVEGGEELAAAFGELDGLVTERRVGRERPAEPGADQRGERGRGPCRLRFRVPYQTDALHWRSRWG